jgi:chorismate synthase
MGSVFGRMLKITSFGESHGHSVGVVIDGVPPGIHLHQAIIQRDLDRRRPGSSRFVSQRQEPDCVEILSGVREEKTLGSPIALVVRNKDVRSSDYTSLSEVFRPGHADYSYFMKYGLHPQPGGGRASGRETLARVAAGSVAKAILEPLGIDIAAYTIRIGPVNAVNRDVTFAESHPLRCCDPEVADLMESQVKAAQAEGDSIGGIVEIIVTGTPAGLGDPVFEKLDALLGGALLSIGGVKGVEVGAGFEVAGLRGSRNNDPITCQGFVSNYAGGILGGISTGQTIVLRIAVKPTPSISLEQNTVDLEMKDRKISIKGRHDPCICPRIVPVAEAMTALVIADAWLIQNSLTGVRHENSSD